jgi:chromosome segregation ATPase
LHRQRLAAHREVLAFYHGLIPDAINPRRTAALTRVLDRRLSQTTRAASVKAVVNDLVERLTKLDIRLRLAARYQADLDLFEDNLPAYQFRSYLRRLLRRKHDIDDIRDAAAMLDKSLDGIAGKLDHLRGEKQRERESQEELERKLAEIEAKGLRGEQSPQVIEQQKNFARKKYRTAQKSGRGISSRRRLPAKE